MFLCCMRILENVFFCVGLVKSHVGEDDHVVAWLPNSELAKSHVGEDDNVVVWLLSMTSQDAAVTPFNRLNMLIILISEVSFMVILMVAKKLVSCVHKNTDITHSPSLPTVCLCFILSTTSAAKEFFFEILGWARTRTQLKSAVEDRYRRGLIAFLFERQESLRRSRYDNRHLSGNVVSSVVCHVEGWWCESSQRCPRQPRL